jgi:crotonobetainyl-CoA:carnitine CoA-transferase CaiB-like acyl-CoA transferase
MRRKERSLLEDVLVLDLADEKGCFCSKLLADLGAIVIRVQNTRRERKKPDDPLESFYHNANKTAVRLNLKSSQGNRSFCKWIERADVLVETFRPGYLDTLNLGTRQLRRINPRLIHLSITGFGQTGPKKLYRSNDGVLSALGGAMYISGVRPHPPQKLFGRQSFYIASLFGANAVLFALRKRNITGKGSHVDLSIQEAVASTLDHVMIDYFHNGEIDFRKADIDRKEPFAVLHCKDGYIQIPIFRNWETLIQLMDSEGEAGVLLETKWQSKDYREKHRSIAAAAVAHWSRNHTKRELFRLGQEMQFPWTPIFSFRDVLGSPQLKSRKFFTRMEVPGYTSNASVPGTPYKFSRFRPAPPGSAPFEYKNISEILEKPTAGRKDRNSELREKASFRPIKSACILSGIRVLDLTRMLSGPYATRILGDFGAEVIKVQSAVTATGAEKNDTPYFSAWNRNKRSICLNLNHPEARDLFLELVAVSDVVVENFAPRVLENWNLNYKGLKQAKPDLIMVSISTMGQTGPWKNYVGFAPTFHAASGLTAATSRRLEFPVSPGHAYGDVVAGLYAALAILSSLEHRYRTGEGQYVDISAYEAMSTVLGPALMKASGLCRSRAVENNDDAVFCGCYPCKGNERWIVLTIENKAQWDALRRVSGKTLPSTGRKFSRFELEKRIARWTRSRAAETIARRLQIEGIAAGVVQNAADLARDSHLAARHFFISLPHPVLGIARADRSALWPWNEATGDWKAAPQLGEANRYIFREVLGLSESDFRSLMKRGIIR